MVSGGLRVGDEEQVRALAQRIDAELGAASRHVQRLRRQNGWLGYSSIVAGALASLLAGGASTSGPIDGQWATTCGIVAALAAVATVSSGLQRQMAVPENLSRAMACAGKLDALKVALTISRRGLAEVAAEYERLVEGNREFLR